MVKNYFREAEHHMERIQYYFDHAGPNGHHQALHHYFKIGECYKKAGAKQPGMASALLELYRRAGELMATMKKRADGPPPDENANDS